MKSICLFLTLLLSISSFAQNSEILGSFISYESIDNTNLRVWIKIYKDCSSSGYLNDTVWVETSNGNFNQRASQYSKRNITPQRYNCANSDTCSDRMAYIGVEEIILVDTVQVASNTNCWITINWNHWRRHDSLSYFDLGSPIVPISHFNSILINRCHIASSSKLNKLPRLNFIPYYYTTIIGFPADFRNHHNRFFLDIDSQSCDSLALNISGVRSKNGTLNTGFGGGYNWNFSNPFGGQIFGQPNELEVFSASRQVWINPRNIAHTGGSYALSFTHYADSAGQKIMISQSHLDMAAFRTPRSAKAPNILKPAYGTSSNTQVVEMSFLVGKDSSIYIQQFDSNSQDIPVLRLVNAVSGPTYKDTLLNGRNAIQVKWNPTISDYRIAPYKMRAFVNDRSCEFAIETFKEVWISVRIDAQISLKIDSLGCNLYRIRTVSATDSTYSPFTRIYGSDNLNPLQPIHPGSDTFELKYAGPHRFISSINNHSKFGNASIDTSIQLNIRKLPNISLGTNKIACIGNILNITPDSVNNAPSPVHYSWYNKTTLVDTTSSYALTIPNDSIELRLKIMDSEGCISNEDTINIYSIKPPQFKLLSDTTVCAGTQVMFNSSILDTNYSYSVLWDNQQSGKSSTYTLDSTRWIQAIFHESVSNCVIKDSVYAQVNVLPQIQNINDTLICSGESITIRPVVNAGSSPFSFYYNGVLGTDSFHTQVTQDIVLQLIVIDSFSCLDSLTTNIKSQNLIPISLSSSILSECVNAPNFDLSGIGSPAGGIWQGAGVINDTLFSPSFVGVGNRLLSYSITDSFGCKSEAPLNFNVLGLPQIQYISSSTSGPVPLVVNFTNQSPNSTKVYWAFGVGNDIDSGNQVSYTYQNIGNYTVQILVKDSNCWDTLIVTNLINVTPSVGILDQQIPELSIYPIPAEKQLTLESTETEFSKLSVYDLSGKLLINKDFNPALKYKLDLSGLASGSYILQVQYLNGQQITKKFLVK